MELYISCPRENFRKPQKLWIIVPFHRNKPSIGLSFETRTIGRSITTFAFFTQAFDSGLSRACISLQVANFIISVSLVQIKFLYQNVACMNKIHGQACFGSSSLCLVAVCYDYFRNLLHGKKRKFS